MFTSLYQIARNTFRESLREPIFLLVLLSALVLIGFYPVLTLFVFFAQEKLVVDSSIATMMVFGWGLAIMIASYAISREIDNGMALLLLSKPVQRHIFIIAKILGIMAALTVFCVITGIATLIALRAATDQFWIDNFIFYGYFVVMLISLAAAGAYNYVTRSSFCSAAVFALLVGLFVFAVIGQFKPSQGAHVGLAFRVIPALVLVVFSCWSMSTMATAFSTRLRLVPNLLLCGAIFLLGLMSDYLIGRNTKEPWQRTPPPGKEQLWVAQYDFSPKELANIEEWNAPQKIEDFAEFVVWTDNAATSPALPGLGDAPESAWTDANGWKKNVNDLGNRAQRLGAYSTKTGAWKYYFLGDYADSKRQQGADFNALIFRRSVNPPKMPAGGTYYSPLPSSGNWVANAFYAAIPNWQLFWMADALSSQDFDSSVHNREASLPPVYMGYSIAYVIAMNALLTLLAILLFWNREAGKQIV